MATEYPHVEFVWKLFFTIQFSGWLRGVSIHSVMGRQGLTPELVRDAKMLKTHFYDPYLCPPLRPGQPSDTDAAQHPPIHQHPLS